VSAAGRRNTGWVYVTDGNLPNPWKMPPTYWTEFVAAVGQGGSGSLLADPKGPSRSGVEGKGEPSDPKRWVGQPPRARTGDDAGNATVPVPRVERTADRTRTGKTVFVGPLILTAELPTGSVFAIDVLETAHVATTPG